MKSLFKALPFLFLLLINTSCNDLDDFDVSQFTGNYKFMIIKYHEYDLKHQDTAYYDGLIRRPYKKENDYEYYDLNHNKLSRDLISIEYKKDTIVTFQVSKSGAFTKGVNSFATVHHMERKGGFTSKDTVKFYLEPFCLIGVPTTYVIGIRKKF